MNKYNICHISRLRMGIDGDGIRELILTAGCPLRCKYCINPFTWDNSEPVEQLTAQDIYERILIDRPYILATNGGITIGGGEPLLQPQLFHDLREVCEAEMTIYAETSLNVEWENIEMAADYIDCFYIDIKAVDEDIYEDYTGSKINRVIENLKRLLIIKEPVKIVVRVPLIPNITNSDSQLLFKSKLQDIGVTRFDLFNYIVPEQVLEKE